MIGEIKQIAKTKNIPYTQADEEALSQYEKGQILKNLTVHPGWKHVLDIMDKQVADAEYDLINSQEADPIKLLAVQRRARSMREFYQQVQGAIEFYIQESANPPQILEAVQQVF